MSPDPWVSSNLIEFTPITDGSTCGTWGPEDFAGRWLPCVGVLNWVQLRANCPDVNLSPTACISGRELTDTLDGMHVTAEGVVHLPGEWDLLFKASMVTIERCSDPQPVGMRPDVWEWLCSGAGGDFVLGVGNRPDNDVWGITVTFSSVKDAARFWLRFQ